MQKGLFLLITFFCASLNLFSDENNQSPIVYDPEAIPVVVIGGGIAGLTAGVYLGEAGIGCLVLEGPKPGGSLSEAYSVRNWPGIIETRGALIVESIRKQAIKTGVKIVPLKAISMNLSKRPFEIVVSDNFDDNEKKTIKANAIILAMGTEPKHLNVEGELQENGSWVQGISHCAICDGSLFKEKEVAVIGGGNSAVAEANYLAKIVKEETVYVRASEFHVSDIKAKERMENNPKIKIVYDTQVSKINSEDNVLKSIEVENIKTKEHKTVKVDGIFLGIGSLANIDIVKDQVAIKDNVIELTEDQATSVKGVFAAGDVCDVQYRQASRSAGQGCTAALQAKTYIDSIGYDDSLDLGSKKDLDKIALIADESDAKKSGNANGSHKGSGKVKFVDQNNFEAEVLKNDLLSVVVFYAPWCGPCKAYTPTIEKLAAEYDGKVDFFQVNVMENVHLTNIYSIISVPSTLYFYNGKQIGEGYSVMSYTQLKEAVEDRLLDTKN